MRIPSIDRFQVPMIPAAFLGVMTSCLLHARAEEGEFRPIVEADMPAGFPEYTPVGTVQIKQYPAYRKAEADATAGRAFWTLFGHIKRNDIAMTAPVEMTYDGPERPREQTMAFLYGNAQMGATGREGRVEVIDVPAVTTVSTGVRGPRTNQAVVEARDRLEAWLDANKERYTADGPLRVMGYNSPFVPRSRNYFEVEVPIRELGDKQSSKNDN